MKNGDKLYVISRQDLSPGYQAVQGMHALTEFIFEYPDMVGEWHTISNFLAFLSVPSLLELEELTNRLLMSEVKFSQYREPDVNDELTAIVLEPWGSKLCSNLPLALKEVAMK